MCPFGFILGYIVHRLVINNLVLNKTKIVIEISSQKRRKYEVNMMKVWAH